MSHLMTVVDAPNCMWADPAVPTLVVSTVPNTGRIYLTVVIEDSTKK